MADLPAPVKMHLQRGGNWLSWWQTQLEFKPQLSSNADYQVIVKACTQQAPFAKDEGVMLHSK